MMSRLRKPTLAIVLVAALTGLSACGDSHTKVTTGTYAGESGANAPYLDVGPLIYEVQLSRELNPSDVEDQSYLEGLGAAERQLQPGQEWFGVFVQVYNNHDDALAAAPTMTISDTQGNVYQPIVPAQSNQFAYRGGTVPPKGQLPLPGSIPAFAPTQGSLLLYKIHVVSLDNRPLKVHIANPEDPSEAASAELDV
jgi:hypothetical protein